MLNTIFSKNGSSVDEKVTTVFKTFDYDKFKFIDANRDLVKNNCKHITDSFREQQLISVVIVNEDFEIIDGQHRVTAAREVRGPIYYIVVPGYGIKEVSRYNANMQKWVRKDHLHSYSTQGKESYIILQDFMRDFPDFGIQVSMKLLSGLRAHQKTKSVNGRTMSSKEFETGKFEICNVTKAYSNSKKIITFKEFYSGYNRATFVSSLLGIIDNPAYDHKRMLSKLKICPFQLNHCANVEQYRILLQKIYNWKARPEDKSDFVNI